MPSASIARASRGTGSRCRAACRMTIEDAQARPSIVPGSGRAVTPFSPYWRTTAQACRQEMYAAIPATASTTAAVDARIAVSAVLPTAGRRGSPAVSAGMRSGPEPGWLSSRAACCFLVEAGTLIGGAAGAVEDAGGGAGGHVERDAVAGVPGHPGHV